jgi:integrase
MTRGKGEGTISKRADGRWCGAIDLGTVNGKRQRKWVYGDTKRAVAEKLRDLQRQQEQGVNLAAEKQTVTQFMAHWLTHRVQQKNKARTYASYTEMTRLHITPHIGHVPLDKLTPQHCQEWLQVLQDKDLSPRTVQYARAILRAALNQAIKWGYLTRNVATLVDPPRVEKYQVEPLTEDQARTLLGTVKGHRLEPLYQVALGLGIRQGEIIALHWADIDFTARTLRVVVGKTPSSSRTLALPDVLVTNLRAHWARQQEERQAQGLIWKEHGLVFPSAVGTSLSARNLVRHFKSMLQRVSMPTTIRFHDLRHSCASFLIAQGVPMRVVMDVLGHSQVSVTMNIYGHVLPETQHAALQTMNRILEG